MKDKYFIDSNIIVYAHDSSEELKSSVSRKIILEGIVKENIAISAQVLSEFFVTVTLKIKKKMNINTAEKVIKLLKAIETIEIDFSLILDAIQILKKYKLSYWDSLIIAAAKRSKCTKLYSEDLNPGQTIDKIEIVNPYLTEV